MLRIPGMLVAIVLLAGFVLAAGCLLGSREAAAPVSVPGEDFAGEVIRVVDGDTVRIALPDGSDAPLRIVGIDTPELEPGENEAGLFDGISDGQLLSRWGGDAREYLSAIALGRRAEVVFDPLAGTKDRYGRILAYLRLPDGSDAGTLLLERGLARVYTPETFERKQQYLAIQQKAMQERTGIWSGMPPPSAASAGVLIREVHYDAAGDDRSNLYDEYIVVRNGGIPAADLAGWQIRDNGTTVFSFGNFSLAPGGEVVVRTGTGPAGERELFVGSDSPILNNEAGIVTLIDPEGREVSRFSWD